MPILNTYAHCPWNKPYHCTKHGAKKVKKVVKKTAKKTTSKAESAAKWTKNNTIKAGKWTGRKAESAVKWTYGGVKKRANIVIENPITSALNPLKVIAPSLPNPVSFVEYTIRNPNEIVKLAKNPFAGAIGMPLALLIGEGRNAALMAGTKPIPKDIRAKLSPHFPKQILDSVRYRVGNSFWSGLPQTITLHYKNRAAITFINVIVFKDKKRSEKLSTWAHEVFHVQQYKKHGLYKFSAMYTLDASSIETPVYRFDKKF